MSTSVKSHAKLNLCLYVNGKRDDGYHELTMLMTCIDLHDQMIFDFCRPGITVACMHPLVPEDGSNLAVKAAERFYSGLHIKNDTAAALGGKTGQSTSWRECVARQNSGVHITIEKEIPVGGGLGGGSSNAAAVLNTLNRHFGEPFTEDGLMEMACSIGADVPFFMKGKTAIAQGIGEKLTPYPALMLPKFVLLFHPGFFASTAEVFKNVDLVLTETKKSNISSLLKTPGDKLAWDKVLHNDLEDAACRCYPELKAFKNELVNSVSERVMMTGSGSTFYSIYSDQQEAHALFTLFSEKWQSSGKRVMMTSFVGG